MKNLGKSLTVLLIAVLFLSSASIALADFSYYPVDLSQIPQPSAPEFNVSLVDRSYDMPSKTVTTTDPYSGKTTTSTTPGYHVTDRKLEIKIKNQPYETRIGNWTFQLYYKIRAKGHFVEWSNASYDFANSLCSTIRYLGYYDTEKYNAINSLIESSNSTFTIIDWPASFKTDDKIDFQLEAIIANKQQKWEAALMYLVAGETVFAYCSSGWSQTQTFTMPDTSKIGTNQTTNSSSEQFNQVSETFGVDSAKVIIAIMGVIIAVLLVALIVSNKRKTSIRKQEVLG